MAPKHNGQPTKTSSPNSRLSPERSNRVVHQGGFGMTVNWLENKMSGNHFGGVSVDANHNIGKTYLISPKGISITGEDRIPPSFACSYSGGRDQAYNDIAARMSEAAGKIYLELCRCTTLQAYDKDKDFHHERSVHLQHPEVAMSGFWIQGSRFVTCAHFLDLLSIPEEQKEHTILYQKVPESSFAGCLKAVVSSEDRVTKDSRFTPKPVSVQLIRVDRESDLAVFQAYNHHQNERPPGGLSRSDIFPLDRCDASQGIFTIGYYGPDVPLQGLTKHDEQTINTFWPEDDNVKPKTYFAVKYAGAMQKRDDTIMFQDVFQFPNYRTVSVGELGQPLSSRTACSNLVLCQMSAWFQSSGGMVGGFVSGEPQKRFKPGVFGLLRGDEGPNNAIVTLTEKGIDWLFG